MMQAAVSVPRRHGERVVELLHRDVLLDLHV